MKTFNSMRLNFAESDTHLISKHDGKFRPNFEEIEGSDKSAHELVSSFVKNYDHRRKSSPKATLHSDGSAHIIVSPSDDRRVSSTTKADAFLQHAGAWHNFSPEQLESHTQSTKHHTITIKKQPKGHEIYITNNKNKED